MKTVDMNFDWLYTTDFREAYIEKAYDDQHFDQVNIPHSNIEIPYNNFDEKIFQFESCYRKHFQVSPLKDDEVMHIRFEGVMAYSKVYINGHYLNEHLSGYTPFEVDITDYLEEENVLVVYVDSRESSHMAPFGHVIDYLTYGGIYREVSLIRRHQHHIKHVFIKPRDVLTNPSVDVQFKLSHEIDVDVSIQINDTYQGRYNLKTHEHTVNLLMPNCKLWSIDEPHLYEMEIKLLVHGEVVDIIYERFGMRACVFKGDGFYLNGRKLKLTGLNRHQSYPYVGYAMPQSAQEKDADILKHELAVNVVRTSHYPQSKHFLNRCDEIGLLVFEEIPGWQHIGDAAWQRESVKDVERMIVRDFNHPCIILWGTRINESRDADGFYQMTHDMAKQLDDTRQTGGVRCIKHSHLIEDVYTYNDFVFNGHSKPLERKKDVTKTDKPYLVTEFNGHMFSTKKFDDSIKRTEHALRHLKVINKMLGDDQITGAIGWCMFDYNTHEDFGSGDKVCYHGVLDMFRIPKSAAYAYGSQGKDIKMHVTSQMNIGDYPSSLIKDIYVLTNCDYVDLFINEKMIKRFYPDKKHYPHLKHPPIHIDDLVGEGILENENFSAKDAALVKKMMIKINKQAFKLSLIDQMKMGYFLLKYKMSILDAEDLYTKYFAGWGDESTLYKFVGYKGDETIEVTKGQVSGLCMQVQVDDDVLNHKKTYDVTRIVVSLEDLYGEVQPYASDAFSVTCEGSVELIGPSLLSLIGGSMGFWIKTKDKGEGKIMISSPRFGDIVKVIHVE